MHLSLATSLLSLLLLVRGASAAPVVAAARSTNTTTKPHSIGNQLSSSFLNSTYAPNTASLANATNQFQTINAFPDPVVKCSGHSLDGYTSWLADLQTAVTATTDAGIYGACDASGEEVDGQGNIGWRAGKVQVYYCNKGFTPNPCSVNEYWRADALITASCGASVGGWVTISDWGKTIGRDATNSDGSFRSECGQTLSGV